MEPAAEKLNLGGIAPNSGDYDEAVALFEDVLERPRRTGDEH